MTIYNAILEEIKNESNAHYAFFLQVKESLFTLFTFCGKYWDLYIRDQILNDAKSILKNYNSAELNSNYTQIRRRRKETTKRKSSLNITAKLYLDFLWDLYKSYLVQTDSSNGKNQQELPKDFFKNMDSKLLDKILDNTFDKSHKESIKKEILSYMDEIMNYDISSINKLNLDNLHSAMRVVKESLDIPKQSIEKCVEEVLSPVTLNCILEYLRKKEYIYCYLYIAAVKRPLIIGKINSYTPSSKKLKCFFKKNFEYNYQELKLSFEEIMGFYYEYIDAKKSITLYKNAFKSNKVNKGSAKIKH